MLIGLASGLHDDPAEPHPIGKQDKTAEKKNREAMHDLVISHMDKTMRVAGGDESPGEQYQDAVLYHQNQGKQDSGVKQYR